jgi:hypothetical protein
MKLEVISHRKFFIQQPWKGVVSLDNTRQNTLYVFLDSELFFYVHLVVIQIMLWECKVISPLSSSMTLDNFILVYRLYLQNNWTLLHQEPPLAFFLHFVTVVQLNIKVLITRLLDTGKLYVVRSVLFW